MGGRIYKELGVQLCGGIGGRMGKRDWWTFGKRDRWEEWVSGRWMDICVNNCAGESVNEEWIAMADGWIGK